MNTIISANEFVLKLFANTEQEEIQSLDRANFQGFMKNINASDLIVQPHFRHSRYNVHASNGDEHLIYNTLYNSFVRLEGNEYDNFLSCDSGSPMSDNFLENGLWISEGVNEFEKYILLSGVFSKYLTRPFSFTITPTMRCNARCAYCYEAGAVMKDFCDENFDSLIEFITSHDLTNGVNFNWFGGEPLLRPDIIDRITDAMNERGIKYGSYIISNGSMLNAEIIGEKFKAWNVHDIQITIDGTENEYMRRKNYLDRNEGDYYKLLMNILKLAKTGIFIHIRINIDRDNAEDVMTLIKDLEALYRDYKNVVFYPAFVTGCPEKMSEEEKINIVYGLLKNLDDPQRLTAGTKMYSYPRIRPCMKEDTNSFSIDSQGFIYDCEHWVGHPDKSFARLGDESITKKISDCLAFNDECRECAYFPKCMGGCAANYLDGDSPCMIEKYLIAAYLRYMLF